MPDFSGIPFTTAVRYVRPAIWAIAVSGGIFIGLSYLEAKKQLKSKSPQPWLQSSPEWSTRKPAPPSLTELATKWGQDLDPISRLTVGIIAANSVVHLASFVVPRYWDALWHQPTRNRNYTLLTSVFVHGGLTHLGVNMFGTHSFLGPVGHSPLFEGSAYHALSFFLSVGILSSFAQHWSTLIAPRKRPLPAVFIRCGGASGALFGLLGVFCWQYPTAQLGILFLPFRIDAQQFLPFLMVFDFVGMTRGYAFANLGHAAHLSGACLGLAYSQFDGKNRIWNPLVRFWKRQLQSGLKSE
ncbi:hypothetical protein P153DRAFT_291055 [Dothidotthia symphoricarpi CBS 119687]|uniref:Peptidase S54 rhomboid domain-containing protein n=1 Tax=Dothidotthia symphoricarpi CBS 119687 TaxID=1392245 RepID=A0A6A6AFG3_9PLEO|nr:uncharacterized protein P153DRAFT_291055 [Dothidotthia symphoricarpi CBS 119687]KAF2129677.1 hypothetical protein P153DRAFT_291055 [Dothidotthia symphoricarpi CBS 119687]